MSQPTEPTGRTLVACLGNIFLSDDGFGVEVARRLARQPLPEGVRVTDYGIRGMHLAYDLAEGFDTTILVDSAQRGDAPGTVYLIEPEPDPPAAGEDDAALARISLFNAHGMQPDLVLSLAGSLGGDAGRVLVVGCEPAVLDALRRHGLLDRTLISCQVSGVLDRVRALEPGAHTGISIGGRLARVSRRWRDWRAQVLTGLASRRWQVVMAQHRLVDAALLEDVAAGRGRLCAWTVNERPAIDRLRTLGIHGIVTGDPRLFS